MDAPLASPHLFLLPGRCSQSRLWVLLNWEEGVREVNAQYPEMGNFFFTICPWCSWGLANVNLGLSLGVTVCGLCEPPVPGLVMRDVAGHSADTPWGSGHWGVPPTGLSGKPPQWGLFEDGSSWAPRDPSMADESLSSTLASVAVQLTSHASASSGSRSVAWL